MLTRSLSPLPIWPQALLLIRLAVGLLLMKHGASVFDAEGMRGMADWLAKEQHLPAPLLMAYLAKGSEFFGGLLLILGLFTRVACVFVLVTMAVAAFGAHSGDVTGEGEAAFLYLLLVLTLLITGPGPWSLDAWLSSRLRPD